jgi:hypothetical protein
MLLTSKKFEYPLLILTLVDILFLPYMNFVASTYSQLFVFLWFIFKDKRVFQRKELRFYYWISFFIAISVIISLFTIPDNLIGEYIIENIKRGLNVGMGISYYFFFSYLLRSNKIKMENWMFAFLVYVVLWGVLYYLNLNTYIKLKMIFNSHDAILRVLSEESYKFRFSYVWTDPNNIGYALVGIVAFLILSRKTSNVILLFSIVSLFLILFICMSGGSVITAIIVIPFTLLVRLKNSNNVTSSLMFILTIVISAYFIVRYSDQITESEVGSTALDRFEDKTQTEEPRFKIWEKAFKSKNILLYVYAGEGNSLFINGQPFKPHSGHIMFLFGYGLICYYMYMYLFFRKSKIQKWSNMLYIMPFLLCFTINIGIGELKYAAIMYMLIANSRIKSFELNVENQKNSKYIWHFAEFNGN